MANYAVSTAKPAASLQPQFLTLAEKQRTIGFDHDRASHGGASRYCSGEIAKAQDAPRSGLALYNPAEHRPLTTRFGSVAGGTPAYRSLVLWSLGYPDAALADAKQALKDAREIDHAATLMFTLVLRSNTYVCAEITDAASEC